MPQIPCNPTTRPPTCRAPNPPCSPCRIAEKKQETERLLGADIIAGAVLDAHLAKKEAYKRVIDEKLAAALRAAIESLKKMGGQPSTKKPPK